MVGSFLVPGSFARTAANVSASELTYRVGLLMELCGAASAIGLGWALYALLRPIDQTLALLGLLWRVTEGVMGIFGVTLGFARIALYAAPNLDGHQEGLVGTLTSIGQAEFPIGVTFFSFGSLIFFWLLLKSRFVVRWLAMTGVAGSVCATILGLTLLLAPGSPALIQVLWLPLLLAEVGVGLIFLIKGADLSWLNEASGRDERGLSA